MENNYELYMISGDTYILNTLYRDSDGEPIDLTGCKLYFQVRKSQDNPDIEFDKSFVVSAEDGVQGILKFALTASETEFLNVCEPFIKYVYAMRLTSADNTEVTTSLSGTMKVTKGVI